jgi:hypothetical protein
MLEHTATGKNSGRSFTKCENPLLAGSFSLGRRFPLCVAEISVGCSSRAQVSGFADSNSVFHHDGESFSQYSRAQ